LYTKEGDREHNHPPRLIFEEIHPVHVCAIDEEKYDGRYIPDLEIDLD
jgi:hypothetical protein